MKKRDKSSIPGSPEGASGSGRGLAGDWPGIGRGLAGRSPAIKTGHQDRPSGKGKEARLTAWVKEHKDDEEYRRKRAEGSRRHLEQLYRDAEFGRMARAALAGWGDMLVKLAALAVSQSDAGGEAEG